MRLALIVTTLAALAVPAAWTLAGGNVVQGVYRNKLTTYSEAGQKTGQVEITSQNHGFCLEPDLFDNPDLVQTHVNLNDGTVEGSRHREQPVLSVQFHPEASPGPHDSHYLFEEFVSMMRAHRNA